MNKIVIGIDQSYNNTGVSIVIDNELYRAVNIYLEGFSDNSEKRYEIRRVLKLILRNLKRDFPDHYTICIVERIRLKSQGFLNINYIKSIGALISVIVDVMHHYNIQTYSVDTRAWKSAVIGTSKPQENKYGLPPEKFPTILWCIKHGYKKYIINYDVGKKKKGVIIKGDTKYTYDNDIADSIGIAFYGFIPKQKQKLELEQ